MLLITIRLCWNSTQAGRLLRQRYVPEKSCKNLNRVNRTQNPHSKCISWGVRGLTTIYYVVYDYNTSGHTELWSIYLMYIYIYIYMCVCVCVWYDIFNCNWLATRRQLFSTHVHTNNTGNVTKQTIHRTTQKYVEQHKKYIEQHNN